MKKPLWSALAFAVCLVMVMSSGCAGGGGGYVYDDGAAYYQGAGYNYGGWGPHYAVGPVRDVDHHDDGHYAAPRDAHPPEPGRGAAPAPRPVPSIPSSAPRAAEPHSR